MAPVIAIILLAQTATAVPVTITPPVGDFDLATVRPGDGGCDDLRPGDDVVVCARRAKAPPDLAGLAAIFEPRPFVPSTAILGGEASVGVEQRSTPMGSAPAAMARFKLKF